MLIPGIPNFEFVWAAPKCVGISLWHDVTWCDMMWHDVTWCGMSTYPNAQAKVKKCIFDSQLRGNWFEFGIIENDFWSSIIWAFQIQDSFTGFKNPKKSRRNSMASFAQNLSSFWFFQKINSESFDFPGEKTHTVRPDSELSEVFDQWIFIQTWLEPDCFNFCYLSSVYQPGECGPQIIIQS